MGAILRALIPYHITRLPAAPPGQEGALDSEPEDGVCSSPPHKTPHSHHGLGEKPRCRPPVRPFLTTKDKTEAFFCFVFFSELAIWWHFQTPKETRHSYRRGFYTLPEDTGPLCARSCTCI